MTRLEFLQSLRSLVSYQECCGVTAYRDADRILAALSRLERLLRGSAAGPESAPAAAGPVLRGSPPAEPAPEPPGAGLSGLAAEVAACTSCSLRETRAIATPGSGGVAPKLVIVGDRLGVDPDRMPAAAELFGVDEDEMLTRIVAALGLAPAEVFITNVIKCSVPAGRAPDGTHVAACLGYLRRQLDLLGPRAVCAMGTMAAQALLGSTRSLVQLRGRFHSYRLGNGTAIPLMATFHPTYLLANPEMKQPTWTDLQAISKLLAPAG